MKHFQSGAAGGSAAVAPARLPVGVVVERRRSSSQWADEIWRPVAVLAGEPEVVPWTEVSREGDAVQFFAGTAEIELHRSETANYRDNLASGTPSLWIVLRPTGSQPPLSLFAVTADPAEGEAFTEPGTDLIESVAMPELIRRWIDGFVAEHHLEHAFHRRERDRADLEALARRAMHEQERK